MFLHSTWRTGSTYVWAKFRNRVDHCCYFEPLNEHLADATPAFIDQFAPWTYANHPALDRPYLDEFRGLLKADGGVDHFPAHLSLGRYRAGGTDALPELDQYFEQLEQFARGRGQVPVYGCVRTDLRVGWFHAHRRGIHILLQRNPRRQFLSCLAQAAQGNIYFIKRGLAILDSNCHDPDLAALAASVGLEHECSRFFADPRWPEDLSKLYMVAYGLHRLASEQARFADLVIDMDEISAEPAAARAAETAVKSLTGTSVSFADCRIETYAHQLCWADPFFDELETRVERAMSRMPALAA